jgi:hypothetical protein
MARRNGLEDLYGKLAGTSALDVHRERIELPLPIHCGYLKFAAHIDSSF